MPMTKPTSEQVTFLAAGSGATQRTVLDKLRDVVSVKDFGAVGDGVADDTAAIQAAIDSTANPIDVVFPQGTYKTTATIFLKRSNVRLVGCGYTTSQIVFTNAAGGTVIAGAVSSSSTITYCGVLNIGLSNSDAATSPSIGLDITTMSYSEFDVRIQVRRANAVCIHGQGNNGQSPYYNRIRAILFGGVDVTQTGILFAEGSWSGGSNGPNANIIGPVARAASLATVVDLQSGTGNFFRDISGEAIGDHYFRLNYRASSDDAGTSSGSNTQVTFNDTTKSWTVNAYANACVVITGGTGSGQSRLIQSNTATQLTVFEPWATQPDNTSTYSIFLSKCRANKIDGLRAEGTVALNPDAISAFPGADLIEISNAEISSLGTGLYVRDASGSVRNSWLSCGKVMESVVVTTPGNSATVTVYPRSGAIGGSRVSGTFYPEWVRVTSDGALADSATVTLDFGGGSAGAGTPSLVAVIPAGSSQAMAIPASTGKTSIAGTNNGVFLQVQTGAAFGAARSLTITWCINMYPA